MVWPPLQRILSTRLGTCKADLSGRARPERGIVLVWVVVQLLLLARWAVAGGGLVDSWLSLSQPQPLPGFHVGLFEIHRHHERPTQGQGQHGQRFSNAERRRPDVELSLSAALAGAIRRRI